VYLFKSFLLVSALCFGFSANAGKSVYTTVDLNKCSNLVHGEGGSSATCPGVAGPLGPIKVEIASGDNENLSFIHAGKRHMAWKHIVAVGSFTFVGGKNRVIEWIKDNNGQLRAIIFRVDAQSNNASKLVVLGVTKYEICYFGTVKTNKEAKALGETAYCGDYLPSEAL
jgi:hypothetical protein